MMLRFIKPCLCQQIAEICCTNVKRYEPKPPRIPHGILPPLTSCRMLAQMRGNVKEFFREMLPYFSPFNKTNSVGGYLVIFGYHTKRTAMVIAYLKYLFIGKLMPRVFRSMKYPAPASSFFNRISLIVKVSSWKQISWIAAFWRVTFMKHIHAFRDWADIEFVSQMGSSFVVPIYPKLSIAAIAPGSRPQPTSGHGLHRDVLFKTFLKGYSGFGILSWHASLLVGSFVRPARELNFSSGRFYYNTPKPRMVN
jgi:hypothetical protein